MTKSQEIEEYILNKISNKEYLLNEKIPPENFFIKKFSASKMTVRSIIEKLKNKNILFSIKGSGVFVSPLYEFINFHIGQNFLSYKNYKFLPLNTNHYFNVSKFNEKYKFSFNFESKKSKSFMFIFEDSNFKTLAYTIMIVDDTEGKVNDLESLISEERSLSKVLEIINCKEPNKLDLKIFNGNKEKVIKIKKIFFKKEKVNSIKIATITKVLPENFQSLSYKNII